MKPALPLLPLLLLLVIAPLVVGGCGSPPPPPPDPGLAFRQEGDAALAEGDPDRAIAAYQLAAALEPRDVLALQGLLDAQVSAREGEAALVTLEALEGVSRDPVDPCPALLLAAEERLTRGDAESARAPARRGRDSDCAGAGTLLARVLAGRAVELSGEHAGRAVALYREAIAIDPGEPGRFGAAASLLLDQGLADEAIALLADGLERHPDDRPLRDLMVAALSAR